MLHMLMSSCPAFASAAVLVEHLVPKFSAWPLFETNLVLNGITQETGDPLDSRLGSDLDDIETSKGAWQDNFEGRRKLELSRHDSRRTPRVSGTKDGSCQAAAEICARRIRVNAPGCIRWNDKRGRRRRLNAVSILLPI